MKSVKNDQYLESTEEIHFWMYDKFHAQTALLINAQCE